MTKDTHPISPHTLWLGVACALLLSCGDKSSGSKNSNTGEQELEQSQSSNNAEAPLTPISEADQPAPPTTSDTAPDASDQLIIDALYPGQDDTRIALVAKVGVSFDQAVIESSIPSHALSLWQNNTRISGTLSFDESDTFTFSPTELLQPNTRYTVRIEAGLMGEDGLQSVASQWSFTTAGDVYTTTQAIIDQCMSETDIAMLQAVNVARDEARVCEDDKGELPAVEKLSWNCTLQAAASIHNNDMLSNDFFAHEGSDGSDLSDRINRVGYPWGYIGENLAAGYRSAESAVAGLLTSPGHCVNIMSPHFKEFGAAYGYNENTYYRHYWTQAFGSPRTW